MSTTTASQNQRGNRNLVKTYSACNPTPGTGIAEAVKAAFAATAAMAIIRNGSTSLLVRPKYIRLVNTVIPASATRAEAAVVVDTGATRYSSGGSSLTARNRDMSSGVNSSTTVRFGALVTGAASSNVRQVSRFQLRAAIPVVYEEYIIAFDANRHDFNTIGGTAAQRHVVDAGPVVLGANQEMLVHTWYPSNATTPASWECEIVWTESKK